MDRGQRSDLLRGRDGGAWVTSLRRARIRDAPPAARHRAAFCRVVSAVATGHADPLGLRVDDTAVVSQGRGPPPGSGHVRDLARRVRRERAKDDISCAEEPQGPAARLVSAFARSLCVAPQQGVTNDGSRHTGSPVVRRRGRRPAMRVTSRGPRRRLVADPGGRPWRGRPRSRAGAGPRGPRRAPGGSPARSGPGRADRRRRGSA